MADPLKIRKNMSNFTVETLSDTVSRIKTEKKEIILLGTAHISSESINEVRSYMESESPDHVCVEIDSGRYKSMEEGNSWKHMDLQKVFKEKKTFLLLGNLVLSSFQRRLGSGLGNKPGEEMAAAIEEAKDRNIPFSLSDRPIQITLQRAWACSNFWNKMKLLSTLLATAFSKEEMDEKEMEELKKGSAIESMMKEMADYLPTVKEVLIDERDQYLATKIYQSPGKKSLAVIGAAHAPGIIEWFRKLDQDKVHSDLEKITHIPPRKFISKLIPWLVPLTVIGLISYAAVKISLDKAWEMSLAWILANGICSAAGALLALARPQTILLSFVAAPITSLNPTIGVGMFSGLLEYFSRKPQVEDMENLMSDSTSVKGWYKNRVTRILLVFFLSSLGSTIGTLWALPRMGLILGGAG